MIYRDEDTFKGSNKGHLGITEQALTGNCYHLGAKGALGENGGNGAQQGLQA